MSNSVIFHLAIPINDVTLAKQFYSEGLGCTIGRENAHAIIFNVYGTQVVAHMTKEKLQPQKGVYPRHFGLIFNNKSDWDALAERAESHSLKFYQQRRQRFPEKQTEHWTFFLEDPFYNLLEFKYYAHEKAIFEKITDSDIGDR